MQNHPAIVQKHRLADITGLQHEPAILQRLSTVQFDPLMASEVNEQSVRY